MLQILLCEGCVVWVWIFLCSLGLFVGICSKIIKFSVYNQLVYELKVFRGDFWGSN